MAGSYFEFFVQRCLFLLVQNIRTSPIKWPLSFCHITYKVLNINVEYSQTFIKGRNVCREFIIMCKIVRMTCNIKYFPRQSLKRFAFRVKLSDSIFLNFLVRSFIYRQISLTWKANLFKYFTWKIFFYSLKNYKEN